MKDPDCNQETTETMMVCDNCGYEITGKQKKKKFSAKTIFTILLALAIWILLSLGFNEVIIVVFLILTIVQMVSMVRDIVKGGGKKKLYFKAVSIVFLLVICSFLIFLGLDAPAIDGDYTLDDLRNAPASCNQSYDILMSIAEPYQEETSYKQGGAPLIGLAAEDVNEIATIREKTKNSNRAEIAELLSDHRNQILSIWEKAQKGRDVIKKLDSFEEIADLEKPVLIASNQELISYSKNMRHMCDLFSAYTCLQTVQGNIDEAIDELVVLNSVFRKLSITARSTLNKSVSVVVNSICIESADFIVNDSRTTQSQLERLAKNFPSFSQEQLSLRNGLLFDYMFYREMFNASELFKIKGRWAIKRNSAIRLLRNYIIEQMKLYGDANEQDKQKGELSVWPGILPSSCNVRMDENCEITFVYKFLYNPVGAIMTITCMPVIETIYEVSTKLQIYQDMLQIVLNKRLGKDFSLKACDYSDEYIIDIENKKIFSPGPDRIENTDDDIKLNIEPKVLGWVN